MFEALTAQLSLFDLDPEYRRPKYTAGPFFCSRIQTPRPAMIYGPTDGSGSGSGAEIIASKSLFMDTFCSTI